MRVPLTKSSRHGAFAVGLLAALVLALAAPMAHAQWKWRDKTGQINASDRPPPLDIPDKDILSRPEPVADQRRFLPAAAASAASGAAPLRAPAGDRELEARRRATEQEQTAKTKADEERVATQRAENCRRARSHFAALDSGQRMARVNDKGEREVLDDRARADEMRQAREVMAADCR
ncbi:MAG: DUF4124 domain-containing protein [Rubrivivax sp.]|nr:DUF4124 domain-containing protein [Rubrivivax sp.]